jgi:hypothetical protein
VGEGNKDGVQGKQDVVNGLDLSASKVRMDHPSYEDIKFSIDDGGMDMFYVKWHDMQLCCDYYNHFAFSDFKRFDTTGNANSRWKIITPEFSSLDEAVSYPIFDGKSLRQVWDECEFFAEL